jgi:hypothetical protein
MNVQFLHKGRATQERNGHLWVANGCACHVACLKCDKAGIRRDEAHLEAPCAGQN